MIFPLTREEIAEIEVSTATFLDDGRNRANEGRKVAWSKRDAGRKRRKERRAARQAKAAWLYS